MTRSPPTMPVSIRTKPKNTSKSTLPSGIANGLVWAIRAQPGSAPVRLQNDDISRLINTPAPESVSSHSATDFSKPAKSWVWLHFDTVHSMARKQVSTFSCLPSEVSAMLAESEYGVMLEATPGLIWGALPAFDDAVSEEDREICVWRFAMRPDLLITTRRNPIPVLGTAFRSLQPDAIPQSPAGVIDRALHEFTDSVHRQLAKLDDELDRAEDALLLIERRSDLGHLGGIVGKGRRRATELRRVVTPLDRVLRDEDLDLPEWAENDLRDRTERQVHAALDDLIALQDRARSLQDELSSSQAEETNRRLYIVSVATILMLPATLVTGFFGMNTGGMFLSSGKLGTIEAGIICAVFMLVTWIFLKLARLL